MISGMLPNNTIWWLSTNGQKIWIESKDLEQDKFKKKGYNIKHDTIFHTGQAVGELTTSRLESRKRKDAWILKVESVLEIYPELSEEIEKKDAENKKKRKELASKNRKRPVPKAYEEKKKEQPKINNEPENIETRNIGTFEQIVNKEQRRDSFDVNSPYVSWIKDEIGKSADGEIILSFPTIKERMGSEFMSMHDLRIFFGLQKILSNIGIQVEQGYKAREHAIVMRKIS
jgi:hypothetical protein